MQRDGDEDEGGGRGEFPFSAVRGAALRPGEERLLDLMAEFRRRQRKRPDLVVRPWWSAGTTAAERIRVGFVVEYCPHGRESVELGVRGTRVTVEGPAGSREATLDLDGDRWALDGEDTGSPETLANYLLRLADRALGEAA